MVQRTSERLRVDSGGTSAVAMTGPGAVNPQDQRGVFDTQIAGIQNPTLGAAPVQVTNQAQPLDPMVQAVLQLAPKVAESFFKRGTEEAYLNGAALAGAGVAESELSGNPLTRAWATAGYKDTIGRMTIADYEATVVKDLGGWKEKSPVEYSQYLAQKRKELLPKLDGMSLDARSNVFKQLLTSERASIAKHTAAYSNFVVDTTSRSLQTSVGVMNTKLDEAKDNPDAYATARDANYAHVLSNIYYNKNLPTDVRDKLMEEQISYTLARGHTDLYKMFDTLPAIDRGDGTKVSVLSTLPLDMQTKLHKQYVSAYNATEVERNVEWNKMYTAALVSAQDPLAPKLPFKDFQNLVDMGVRSKAISVEAGRSAVVQYAGVVAKATREGTIANQAMTGDVQGMAILGATPKESVDALFAVQTRKGTPLHVIMDTMRDVGTRTGNTAAFTKFGEMITPAISALMTNETGQIDGATAKILSTYTASLDRAKVEGATHFQSTVLAALPEEQRVFLTRLAANMEDKSLPIDAAIRKTRDAQLEDKALSPAARAHRTQQHAKENQEAADSLDEMQLFRGVWNSIKGAFSPVAKAEGTLLPKTGVFGWGQDDVVTAALVQQYRTEYLIEANSISLTNPSLPAGARDDLARSNIAQRTIPVGGRAMILPRGASAAQFFGVSGSADSERIGAAIDTLIKPSTQGGSLQFSVRDGKLMYTEITEKGQTIPGGFLDPKDIGRAVMDKRQKEAQEYLRSFGSGDTFEQTYKAPDGKDTKAKVRFNGDNTAGLDNEWALKIRQSLVQKEGVRAHPYKDGNINGKQLYSVGVGVNSGNPQYYPKPGPDGTVSFEAISTSFAGASDQAMKMAAGVASKIGLKSFEAYEMLTHIVYQSPSIATANRGGAYAPFLEALAARDSNAAFAALRKSPAYTSSGNDRKKWYEEKLRQTLNQ